MNKTLKIFCNLFVFETFETCCLAFWHNTSVHLRTALYEIKILFFIIHTKIVHYAPNTMKSSIVKRTENHLHIWMNIQDAISRNLSLCMLLQKLFCSSLFFIRKQSSHFYLIVFHSVLSHHLRLFPIALSTQLRICFGYLCSGILIQLTRDIQKNTIVEEIMMSMISPQLSY